MTERDTARPPTERNVAAGLSSGARRAVLDQDVPVVALGASAGGLEALELFFANVPKDSGMAFVVVQHLDPTRKGMLPELLQRATAMPVAQAKNRMRIRRNRVYVIPPNKDLSILHQALYLLDPVAPRGLRLPIDFLFRALAYDRGAKGIGVILSGMGSDGTLGLRAIKEHGGLILVQDPATAKFDGMPRSAIGTGLVDIVANADELPARIVDYMRHVSFGGRGVLDAEVETAAQKSGFDKICILLRAHTGHDFSLYKKSTVYRRIERRMAIHQIARMADYVRYLSETPQEAELLFKELLIGVTSFFRDPTYWSQLKEKSLTELVAASSPGTRLRAWVAGCSTGEEAYSLAICFSEVLADLSKDCSLQIFATDLDGEAIARARQGVFPANIAADVSPERLARYFVEDGPTYRVRKEIRETIVFARHDVIRDPPFTRLDILTCRNLLIYLNRELQQKLLPLFHYTLKPGGILMLGSAESIGEFTDLFSAVDAGTRLFRRGNRPTGAQVEFPSHDFPKETDLASMPPKPDLTGSNLQNVADQLLLQRFAPAAVLVNAAGDLVYISGRTGKYLEPAAGKANWNIHAMAREGLRQEIALALTKALRSGERVVCRNVRVETEGGPQTVHLTAEPLRGASILNGMVFLVFSDAVDTQPAPGNPSARPGTRRTRRETELEQALSLANQEIQTLRAEMQVSHEENRSANEELQSANEELQSTNEELTTSKEEMQSLNEELQSVNIELQSKVDELSAANNDMKNLLDSTDIATLFLDGALCVRRFNAQTKRVFKLIPGDIGRPLSDIATDLDYAGLQDDALGVLRTLAFVDRDIATHDGRWFQVKIMPYRTLENVIDGVVITMNDIAGAKRLEGELRAQVLKGEPSP